MQNLDLIENEIKTVIDTCDKLIHQEKFEELVNFYTEDAVLVILSIIMCKHSSRVEEY